MQDIRVGAEGPDVSVLDGVQPREQDLDVMSLAQLVPGASQDGDGQEEEEDSKPVLDAAGPSSSAAAGPSASKKKAPGSKKRRKRNMDDADESRSRRKKVSKACIYCKRSDKQMPDLRSDEVE